MLEILLGNYFLNVMNLFDIVKLELLFSKYMESSSFFKQFTY